jgi:DNA-binding NarL/FixJ family response regulator
MESFAAKPVSVVVSDAQAVFRSGLIRLMTEDGRFDVVSESDGGPEIPRLCGARSVDVLVTDLRLARVDAVDLVRKVRTCAPGTRVLVLALEADWRVIPALAAGASGYLLKEAEPEAILSAVVSVHCGEQVLCREASHWVSGTSPATRLTRREMQVLRMVAQGADNKEIAEWLQVGEKTVRNYVSRVYQKQETRDRKKMAMFGAVSIDGTEPLATPRPTAFTSTLPQTKGRS